MSFATDRNDSKKDLKDLAPPPLTSKDLSNDEPGLASNSKTPFHPAERLFLQGDSTAQANEKQVQIDHGSFEESKDNEYYPMASSDQREKSPAEQSEVKPIFSGQQSFEGASSNANIHSVSIMNINKATDPSHVEEEHPNLFAVEKDWKQRYGISTQPPSKSVSPIPPPNYGHQKFYITPNLLSSPRLNPFASDQELPLSVIRSKKEFNTGNSISSILNCNSRQTNFKILNNFKKVEVTPYSFTKNYQNSPVSLPMITSPPEPGLQQPPTTAQGSFDNLKSALPNEEPSRNRTNKDLLNEEQILKQNLLNASKTSDNLLTPSGHIKTMEELNDVVNTILSKSKGRTSIFSTSPAGGLKKTSFFGDRSQSVVPSIMPSIEAPKLKHIDNQYRPLRKHNKTTVKKQTYMLSVSEAERKKTNLKFEFQKHGRTTKASDAKMNHYKFFIKNKPQPGIQTLGSQEKIEGFGRDGLNSTIGSVAHESQVLNLDENMANTYTEKYQPSHQSQLASRFGYQTSQKKSFGLHNQSSNMDILEPEPKGEIDKEKQRMSNMIIYSVGSLDHSSQQQNASYAPTHQTPIVTAGDYSPHALKQQIMPVNESKLHHLPTFEEDGPDTITQSPPQDKKEAARLSKEQTTLGKPTSKVLLIDYKHNDENFQLPSINQSTKAKGQTQEMVTHPQHSSIESDRIPPKKIFSKQNTISFMNQNSFELSEQDKPKELVVRKDIGSQESNEQFKTDLHKLTMDLRQTSTDDEHGPTPSSLENKQTVPESTTIEGATGRASLKPVLNQFDSAAVSLQNMFSQLDTYNLNTQLQSSHLVGNSTKSFNHFNQKMFLGHHFMTTAQNSKQTLVHHPHSSSRNKNLSMITSSQNRSSSTKKNSQFSRFFADFQTQTSPLERREQQKKRMNFQSKKASLQPLGKTFDSLNGLVEPTHFAKKVKYSVPDSCKYLAKLHNENIDEQLHHQYHSARTQGVFWSERVRIAARIERDRHRGTKSPPLHEIVPHEIGKFNQKWAKHKYHLRQYLLKREASLDSSQQQILEKGLREEPIIVSEHESTKWAQKFQNQTMPLKNMLDIDFINPKQYVGNKEMTDEDKKVLQELVKEEEELQEEFEAIKDQTKQVINRSPDSSVDSGDGRKELLLHQERLLDEFAEKFKVQQQRLRALQGGSAEKFNMTNETILNLDEPKWNQTEPSKYLLRKQPTSILAREPRGLPPTSTLPNQRSPSSFHLPLTPAFSIEFKLMINPNGSVSEIDASTSKKKLPSPQRMKFKGMSFKEVWESVEQYYYTQFEKNKKLPAIKS